MHLTTLASYPDFFSEKVKDFYTIKSVYPCGDYVLNHTCNFNSVRYVMQYIKRAT